MDVNKQFISWKYFIYVLIVIIVIGVFFFFQGEKINSYTVREREVISGFQTSALILRDENTYLSPLDGILHTFVNEGDRVAYGQKIAYIKGEEKSHKIYAKKPGVISFAFDGLEEELKYGKITPQVLDNYLEYERNYKQYITEDEIKKDDKLYRNINNYNQYLLIKVSDKWLKRFSENEDVFIDKSPQNDYSNLIEGFVKKIYRQNQKEFLLIQLKSYEDSWNNNRWVDIKLIKNIYRGLAVPKSAVFNTPDGIKLLKYTYDHKIVAINIIIKEETAEWIIVENLNVGDEAITNPEKYDFGRSAN
ncbi:MAG: hypothetical protein K9K32_01145 [Halanaerobiales bacterium]|nr:hypothetical protein [Halanaerobiales bacterium]